MTKCISSKDSATFEETIKAAELFKKHTVSVIPNSVLFFMNKILIAV
jgi:hypothetical protein